MDARRRRLKCFSRQNRAVSPIGSILKGGVSRLHALFKTRSSIPLAEAVSILKIPAAKALEWAELLREEGLIKIEIRDGKEVLIWAGPVEEETTVKEEELATLLRKKAALSGRRYGPLERRFETEAQMLYEELERKARELADLERKVAEIPEAVARIDAKAKKLKTVETYARKNLSQVRLGIVKEAARIRDTQARIDAHLAEAEKGINAQTARLKSVERSLIRLRKIEHWMMMQQVELEKGIDAASTERRKGMEKVSALRGSAGEEYVREFKQKLGNIREKYAKELHEIKEEEDDINRQIVNARKAIYRIRGSRKE